jgi:hypothetical protein
LQPCNKARAKRDRNRDRAWAEGMTGRLEAASMVFTAGNGRVPPVKYRYQVAESQVAWGLVPILLVGSFEIGKIRAKNRECYQ